MATFKPKIPIVTETPLIEVEGLQPGEHTFQLEVEDDAGNRSQPILASVKVLGAAPVFSGLSPPFGDWGEQVVIRGANFDPEPAKNGVSFNGVNAPVLAAAAQQLTVRVPKPATSGPVIVKTEKGEAAGPSPFVIPRTFSVGVGPQPVALAHEEERNFVWVLNSGGPENRGTVSVVGLAQRKVLLTVPVGGAPREVALSPAGARRLCVVTNGAGTLSVINMGTGQVVGNLQTSPNPSGVGITADGRFCYVVCAGAASSPLGVVNVFDLTTLKLALSIRVGRAPARVVFGADGQEAFVNNTGDGTLSVIDAAAHKVSDVVKVGGDAASSPQEVDTVAEGYPCWSANQGSSNVSIISREHKVVNAALGFAPSSVAASRKGSRAFLTGVRDPLMAVVDGGQAQPAARRIRMHSTGAAVRGVVLTPDEAGVVVLHPEVNAVSVVDATTLRVRAVVNVPATPLRCLVTRDGKFACVVCHKANALGVIELESILP